MPRLARLESAGGLRARLTRRGDLSHVPPAVAAELYRIGEEALTNVMRHAGASHVLVNLEVAAATARLVIEDDGAGIDTSEGVSPGFGLLGMRERAERLGGRLVLESDPGSGTRVEATIPFGAGERGEGQRDS